MGEAAAINVEAAWSIVIPVKRLDRAKTRLDCAPDQRARIALAMATDTVAAVGGCPSVFEVIVVTDDPQVAATVRPLGARVVTDDPAAGLNPALRHGAAQARRPWVGFVSSDLPALHSAAVATVLVAAQGHGAAVVADAAGTGTTMLLVRDAAAVAPQFGSDSYRAHRAAGAVDVTAAAAAGARRDVDTMSDLQAAAALGVGPATAAALPRAL